MSGLRQRSPTKRSITRWSGSILLAMLALVVPGKGSAQEAPSSYAIQNARLVTVSGRTIDQGTIVVEDGVITGVGRNVDVPAGVWVIDAEGLTVYPGLIDALSTLGMPSEMTVPSGAGAGGRFGGGPPGGRGGQGEQAPFSRGPEDRPATFTWRMAADELEGSADDFSAWRNAGFTTVVTGPSRGFFPGHAAVVNLAGERPRDMVVEPNVAQRANLSGGPGHRGYPGSLAGAFAYIKQFFGDAAHYARAQQQYDANPRGNARPTYDRALEGALSVQSGVEPLLFPGSSAAEIGRALKTSSDIGARAIVYGGAAAYRMTSQLSSAGVPVLVSVDWPAAPRDPDPEADEQLADLRHRLLAPTSPALLQESGVPFAFYSDGKSGSEVVEGVKKAVEAGLSQEDAVRAMTLSAAEIYGVDDRLGSLEVGKIANLTVTDGDLFGEGSVKMVFVDGQRFEAEDGGPTAMGGGGRPGRGGGGRPGAGRGAAGDTEEAGGDTTDENVSASEADEGPNDNDLRAMIGPDYSGPYRDDAVTVIQNATILTVTRGTLENATIILRNGKIAEIGTDLSVPSGAHVVDGEGKFVMPGIIDAHSHIVGGFNEGAVSVSAMTRAQDVMNPDDINVYRALAGGVTMVNILHGSANAIGGQNAVIKNRWGMGAEGLLFDEAIPGIKFALGENPTRDRNPDRYPATRMGVMDVIREAFIDAQEYQAEWGEWNAGNKRGIEPRRDLKLEALAEILRGERQVHAHSYRADEILQLLLLADEFGFKIAAFQHVLEGYKVAEELASHGAGASTFGDWWGYKVEAYDAIPYNAAIMNEHGVLVSINSDSNEEMRHLNEEVAKTQRYGGMTDDEALAMITINPATQLGISHRVGSLEVGKDADLVVYDRHPLDNYAVPQMTFVDGKLYFDIDGDRLRQAAIEAEKRALKGETTRPITEEDGAGAQEDDR
jgi:imidazolonepropionase-like amidohydrolase